MRRSENSSSAGGATGGLARLGVALADWSERWFPDAFVFALVALIIVFVAGMAVGTAKRDLVRYFGEGFWSLIPFTMQMAIIIVGGYVVATSPPVHRLIRRLARIPRTPRGAVAFVAFFAMATSLVSWGLSLIFSGLLVREVVKNVRATDYRAIGAAAYLGTGTVWALGISSSAALLMATPASIPAALLKISGAIPLNQTIYTWQSLTTAGILMLASVVVAYLSAPATSSRTAESFGITESAPPETFDERRTPAEWLEHVPVLSVAVGLLGLAYLGQVVAARGPLAALDLNTYNLLFLMVGLLLHWRPRSFTRAVNEAVPATSGVLIQFPFYGGIFGIVTMSPLSRELAGFFVRISSQHSFPVLVAIYSGILGLFPFGRQQVDHRGALPPAGGQGRPREPRLGGADLQHGRGPAESGESILDAAVARNPEGAGARSGRLWIPLFGREFGSCPVPRVVFCAYAAVRAAGVSAVSLPYWDGYATVQVGGATWPTMWARKSVFSWWDLGLAHS